MTVSIGTISQWWSNLEILGSVSSGDRRSFETEVSVSSGKVLLALDGEAQRHLLIPVSANEISVEDRKSRGIHISSTELIDGGITRKFVDITCQISELKELFSYIVIDLLEAVQVPHVSTSRICSQVLERWRELLASSRGTGISTEKLIGLYGELIYLRELVSRRLISLDCWKGPEGGKHDFSDGRLAVEVKTSMVRHGRVVSIHGHQQLEIPSDGELYFAVVKVEEGSETDLSVPDLVSSILSYGVSASELIDRLSKMGYFVVDTDTYRTRKYRVTENSLYSVDASFPKIISGSFIEGRMPAGVVRLDYQIDLTGEPPHPLTDSARTGVLDYISDTYDVSMFNVRSAAEPL